MDGFWWGVLLGFILGGCFMYGGIVLLAGADR